MKQASFAEILEQIISENQDETLVNQEVQGALEPAYLSTLLTTIPTVRLQNHSVSSYSRLRIPPKDFKLKAQGMTTLEFKAYETLLYALELPILVAHRLLPETFTLAQLKKAYKLAAVKNHPDRGGSHESFLEIKKCYDILEVFAKTKAHDIRP